MSVKDWIDEIDKKPEKETKAKHEHLRDDNYPTCTGCRAVIVFRQRQEIIRLLNMLVEK